MPPALQNPVTLWLLLTAALAGLVYAFMRPELRWKAIGYGAFLLACAVAIWPPYERDGVPGRIKLGMFRRVIRKERLGPAARIRFLFWLLVGNVYFCLGGRKG